MPDPSPTEPAAASSERPYIQAVHFEGWAPLGGPVTLELSPRRTVLVGRNGGGKSVLLEGLRAAMDAPYSPSAREESPPACTFDVRLGAKDLLHYQYRFTRTDGDDPRRGKRRTLWTERAWQDDPSAPLWRTEKGRLHQRGEAAATLGEDNSALSFLETRGSKPATSLNELLTWVTHVKIDLLRGPGPRAAVYAEEANQPDRSTLTWLAQYLCGWARESPEDFEELNQVGRRIGIWKELSVQTYQPTQGRPEDSISALQIDGVNLGFVSDGTLRLLDILIPLISFRSFVSSVMLLIDEPELGIHPGLLARLLAELDAYGSDRQIVLATHSPQVVSWARPEELRFVERIEGHTVVRSLSAEQAARVQHYLEEQGSLGEFVYGGGADE